MAFKLPIIGSEIGKGVAASVLLHAAALLSVSGWIVQQPHLLSASGSQAIEIQFAELPTISLPPPTEQTGSMPKVDSTSDSVPALLKIHTTPVLTNTKSSAPKTPSPKWTKPSYSQSAPSSREVKLTRVALTADNSDTTMVPVVGLSPASSTWSPKPPYPFEARKAKFEGRVLLAVKISPEGAPTIGNIVQSSGREDCDQVALDTVLKRWRFEPAKIFGRPVAWEQKIEVEYRLHNG